MESLPFLHFINRFIQLWHNFRYHIQNTLDWNWDIRTAEIHICQALVDAVHPVTLCAIRRLMAEWQTWNVLWNIFNIGSNVPGTNFKNSQWCQLAGINSWMIRGVKCGKVLYSSGCQTQRHHFGSAKSLSSLLLGNTEGHLDTKGGCTTLSLHSSPDIWHS